MELICVQCGKVLTDDDLNAIIYNDDGVYFLCSPECREKYDRRSGKDRRVCKDRRLTKSAEHIPERRSGEDRRNGKEWRWNWINK